MCKIYTSLNLRHETKKGRVKPYENKKESQEIQNTEEGRINAKKIDRELNYRPTPKLPYIFNASGEVKGILENIVPKNRPPPKPPPITLNRE